MRQTTEDKESIGDIDYTDNIVMLSSQHKEVQERSTI